MSRRSSASLDLDILQAAAEGGESEEARADRSCLRTSSCMRTPSRPGKKQGETISKGHRNYDLRVLALGNGAAAHCPSGLAPLHVNSYSSEVRLAASLELEQSTACSLFLY